MLASFVPKVNRINKPPFLKLNRAMEGSYKSQSVTSHDQWAGRARVWKSYNITLYTTTPDELVHSIMDLFPFRRTFELRKFITTAGKNCKSISKIAKFGYKMWKIQSSFEICILLYYAGLSDNQIWQNLNEWLCFIKFTFCNQTSQVY